MLPAIVFVYLIGVARLRIWTVEPGSRRLTIGMLEIATASLLFLHIAGDRRIDPLMLWGANLGNLVQHLLAVAGCYELGAIALANSHHRRRLLYWCTYSALTEIGLIVTYRIGDQFRIPAEEFAAADPASYVHQWLLVTFMVTTFAMLAGSLIPGSRWSAADLRKSLAGMFAVSVLALCCNGSIALGLAFAPTVVHHDYHVIATAFTIPALIMLAAAGIPGLRAGWAVRNDPR